MTTRLTILAALLLAACPAGTGPGRNYAPLDEPVEFEAAGDYEHEPSGMLFPPTVADFVRVELTRYDRDGLDVSVGYNHPMFVALTVYVLPASIRPAPEKELDDTERSVRGYSPDAKLEEKGSVRIAQGGQVAEGLHMRQHYRDRKLDRTMVTETYVFRRTGNRMAWLVKYRITYPASIASNARPAIDRFVESLWLP
jgi:hypothetical protein